MRNYLLFKGFVAVAILLISFSPISCARNIEGTGGEDRVVIHGGQSALYGAKETVDIFDVTVYSTGPIFTSVSNNPTISISGDSLSITITNQSNSDLKGVVMKVSNLSSGVSLVNSDGSNFHIFGDIASGQSINKGISFSGTGSGKIYVIQKKESIQTGILEAGSTGKHFIKPGQNKGEPQSEISNFKTVTSSSSPRSVPTTGAITSGASPSLKIDTSGNTKISYLQVVSYDLKYTYWDGSAWQFVIVDGTGKTGFYSSLALSSLGNPRISYYYSEDSSNNVTGDLRYAYCDANCNDPLNWGMLTLDSLGDVGGYTSLVLNSSGNPRISYYDYTNGDLKFAYCDGGCENSTNWIKVTVDSTGDVGRYTSIALNSSGNPRISYYDYTNGDLKYAYCDSGCSDPLNWTKINITPDDPFDVGGYISLVLNSSDNPRISYYDFKNWDLKYTYCDTGCNNFFNWIKVTVDGTLDANNHNYDMGGFSSLVLDTSGNPVITYYYYGYADLAYGGAFTTLVGNLRYAYCVSSCSNAASWAKRTVDSGGDYFILNGSVVDTGWFSSAAITNSGTMYIAYYTTTSSTLTNIWIDTAGTTALSPTNTQNIKNLNLISFKHPIPTTGLLEAATVPWFATIPGYNSDIETDSNGYPHIAYALYNSGQPSLYNGVKYKYWDGTQWATVTLESVPPNGGVTPRVSIALNSAGKPRILYTWNSYYLVYAWCDSSCSNISNWNKRTMGYTLLANAYFSPSISLDSSGNPRISYFQKSDGTVKYSYCDANCGVGALRWGDSSQFGTWGPNGIAIDSLKNVYVSDPTGYRIKKYDSTGGLILTWGSNGTGNGQFNIPSGVAVDSLNNIYVVDRSNSRIQKFDSSGNYLLQWGSNGTGNGQFSFTYCCTPDMIGIAVDSLDNVYVVDSGNRRIQKFDSSGNFLLKWGSFGSGNGQFNNPRGIAIDSSNNVYVADQANSRVQKFDISGNFLLKWGSAGTGNGQFSSTIQGIAVDSLNNVYVVDSGNNRVQKFDISGNFLLKWTTVGGSGIDIDSSGASQVAESGNNTILKSVDGQDSVWTTVTVDTVGSYYDWAGYPNGGRISLKLDSSNSPRVAYYNANTADLLYAYCDTGCNDITNWTKSTVVSSNDAGKYASLRLNSSGNPRIMYMQDNPTWRYDWSCPCYVTGYNAHYSYCDTGCGTPANWTTAINLSEATDGSFYDLVIALDGGGNPRVSYTTGTLYYSYCNSGCSTSGNWTKSTITATMTYGVSLSLDSTGSRHMSLGNSSGLYYAFNETM